MSNIPSRPSSGESSPGPLAFPVRLKLARLFLGSSEGRTVSNAEFGKRVGAALGRDPIDQSAVSRWGRTVPDVKTLEAIASVCDVDPGWLAFGDKSSAVPPWKEKSFAQTIRQSFRNSILADIMSALHAAQLTPEDLDRASAEQVRLIDEIFGGVDLGVADLEERYPTAEVLSKIALNALNALPELERRVLKLHLGKRLSYDAIARSLGISSTEAANIGARAIEQFRGAMDVRFEDAEARALDAVEVADEERASVAPKAGRSGKKQDPPASAAN